MRFSKSKVVRKSRMPLKRTERGLKSILEFQMNNSSLKVLTRLESTENDVLERPSILTKVVNQKITPPTKVERVITRLFDRVSGNISLFNLFGINLLSCVRRNDMFCLIFVGKVVLSEEDSGYRIYLSILHIGFP